MIRSNLYKTVICAALLVTDPSLASEQVNSTASVIDGDTIEIHGQRIRLFGIDAPEGRQECNRGGEAWLCGKDAALALADKIGSDPLECYPKDRDRYGRTVAICRLSGEDLNAWMVREGWALAYRHYSLDYVVPRQRLRDSSG